MRGKRRKITPEQQEYLSHLGINEDDRNGRYYRKDLADMQEILDTNGHETPNEADYQELRKQRKNDTEFKSSRSRIEQYFQYKAEKGRQINMFDNETQEPRTDNQDLAGALTELDEQSSTDIQEPQTFTVNAPEKETNTVNELENNSNGKNTKKGGRKKTGNEKKTAKIMIYVEPSLLADIQDLAYSNRSSMVTLITGILEDYISANQDRLQKFRNL